MADIGMWSKKYWVKPTERMARRWEAFVNAVKWGEPISTRWEQFTNKLVVKYAEWLGKMDRARVNWDLHDGSLYWEYDWTDDTFRRWFHWSPAKFDSFDSSHMGEWEGNQAHWWGHYIAIEERTWRHYADMGKDSYEYDWTSLDKYRKDHQYMPFDERDAQSIAEEMALLDVENNKNLDLNELKDAVKTNIHNAQYESIRDKYIEVLDALDNIDEWKIKRISWRHIYDVDIPDPIKKNTPTWSNYLEEDAEIPKSQYMKIINEAKRQWLLDTSHLDYYIDYARVGHWDKMTGYSLYRALEEMMKSDKKASKFLESLGYDWIHYFWWRDWEAYVIFNDDAIDIINRNDL